MIEIHNHSGTESYGCCRNMKEAHGIITRLKASGEIPAGEKIVTVCHYKNRILQKVSVMEFRAGKWRPLARHGREIISPQVLPAV